MVGKCLGVKGSGGRWGRAEPDRSVTVAIMPDRLKALMTAGDRCCHQRGRRRAPAGQPRHDRQHEPGVRLDGRAASSRTTCSAAICTVRQGQEAP
jgi:hypothetical protein